MRYPALRRAFVVAFSISLGLSSPLTLLAGTPSGTLQTYAKARTWTDASGKHKVQGGLKFADSKEVQIAQSNGKTIKIKVANLSPKDRAFVKEFLDKEAELGGDDTENPFILADDSEMVESDDDSMSESSLGGSLSFKDAAEDDEDTDKGVASSGKSADPERRKAIVQNVKRFSGKFDKPFWSVKPLRGFPDVKFEEFGVVTGIKKPTFAGMRLKSGGTFGVTVLGAYQQGSHGSDFSRYTVIFGKGGAVTNNFESDTPWKLMSISSDGKRAAMVRIEGFDKGNDVGIFNITKDGLVPDFQFTAGGGSWDEVLFVDFAAGNRLVTISQKSNVGIWDLANKSGVKALYVGNSGGIHSAVLSPAREVMAMPAGNGIAIYDLASAKLAGLIARPNPPSQLSFSPDAKKLMVFEPYTVTIYNLENGEFINQVPVAEHRSDAPITWLGKYLLIGNVVYDVERVLPVWTYEGDTSHRSTIGPYVFTAFPGENSSSFSMMELPHQAAIDAAGKVDPATIYAIQPGDGVTLEYNFRTTPTDKQEAIKKVMEAKVAKLGWIPSASSNIKIRIDMEQGKQESKDYYQGDPRFPFRPIFGNPTGPKETVSYTPWTQKIQIFTGDKMEYEAVGYRTAPSNLTLNEGETTVAAVNRYCQPSPDFFEHLPIAPKLLKKEYQGGLGKSSITADGLK